MKYAFIIQVHNYLEQFKEIVDLWRSPNHFINVDKKVEDAPFVKELARYPNLFFLQGKRTYKRQSRRIFTNSMHLEIVAQSPFNGYGLLSLLKWTGFPLR